MGGKLGTIFARAGHEVVFSYARSDAKLKGLARAAGASARAGSPRDAADHADVVLLAVNWPRLGDVLKQAGDLSGKVVITCSLPMNADNSALVVARTSSGAEALAKKIRNPNVVSAFGTVPSEVFFAVHAARRRTQRPSMLYCGDGRASKRVAATLIGDIGFESVDIGPLRMARNLEPFTLAIGQLAYETGQGPAIAYRIERFKELSK